MKFVRAADKAPMGVLYSRLEAGGWRLARVLDRGSFMSARACDRLTSAMKGHHATANQRSPFWSGTLVAAAAAIAFVLPAESLRAQQPRKRPAPAAAVRFKTTMTTDEMKGKQLVVETALGTFVIELLPGAAPNHAGYVIRLAREGAYDHTTFHRAIKYGII